VTDDLANQLARVGPGSYGFEAATEILLRFRGARFARPGWPWIKDVDQRPWIDFAEIAGGSGALSGGERRVLLIAASLAEEQPIELGDAVAGLDRRDLALVLAAVSHAGGSHHHVEILSERTAAGDEIVTLWGPRLEPGPLYP
jgi:hypothetical protein